jgi:hypothetical protein
MRAVALPGIGQANVDSVFPDIHKQGIPNEQHWAASIENNSLRTPGERVPVIPGQNHSIHFDVHYQDLVRGLQDPQRPAGEKLIHLGQAGMHMQEHLQGLSGDPSRKQEVKQKQSALKQLGKLTDQLNQQVQAHMQAQAQRGGNGQGAPQQMDPDDIAKITKVHGDIALKAQKQKGDLALKARKEMVHEKLQDLKTAAEIRRQDARQRSGM